MAEKHIYKLVDNTHLTGEEDIVFSTTQKALIRHAGISVNGKAFAADEMGMVYLWRDDGTHFTLMLNIAQSTPRNLYYTFGAYPLEIPASEEYCFKWAFTNIIEEGRLIFCDIAYDLAA